MNATALRSVQEALGGDSFPKCESPSLRLEKLVRIGDNLKKQELERVCDIRPLPNDIPAPRKNSSRFVVPLSSPLAINLTGGILENAGLSLHRNFGFPVIPGSALKGVARHAAWCEWDEETDSEKKKKIANDIADVFGFPTGDTDGLDASMQERPRSAGQVAFLPAVATNGKNLGVDIVNCHHANYYQDPDQIDATDDEAPIPVFFPIVKTGTPFLFTLVSIRGKDLDGSFRKQAESWLLKALELYGIGAKTAAGYGCFNVALKAEETAKFEREQEKAIAQRAQLRKRDEWISRVDALCAQFPESTIVPVDIRKHILSLQKDATTLPQSYQRHLDRLNSLLKRMPEESPLEKFRNMHKKEFFKNHVAKFEQLNPAGKNALYRFLSEDEIGKGYWTNDLRTGQKGDIDKGVQAIRKYINTNKLKKLP